MDGDERREDDGGSAQAPPAEMGLGIGIAPEGGPHLERCVSVLGVNAALTVAGVQNGSEDRSSSSRPMSAAGRAAAFGATSAVGVPGATAPDFLGAKNPTIFV